MNNQTTAYPVQFDITRQAAQNRITNLPLAIGLIIRAILLIPHLIILYFFGIVAAIVYFIAQFAILFTGKYPEGMYNLVLVYLRWNGRVGAYLLSLFDKYPPFHGDEDPATLFSLTAIYPATSSRLLNFPILGHVIRAILMIPHLLIVLVLTVALFVVVFIARFAILFTGSFPEGMHTFCVGASRWGTRVNAYLYGLTDMYPPFTTRE